MEYAGSALRWVLCYAVRAQLYLTLCNPIGEQAPLSIGFF